MGCYLMVTNQLFLGQTEEFIMGKASESAAKSYLQKLLKNLNSLVLNYILPFSLMFHIAERLTLIFLGNLQ